MKRNTGLQLFIAIVSFVSGYLMSKASLVGKVGMSLFYKEYRFLKTWWKGGLLIYIVLMILFIVLGVLNKRHPAKKAKTINISSCVLAIIGLYFTYNDFRHTLSHRLLGERFHLGVYLFWFGWIIISLYHLWNAQTKYILPARSSGMNNEV